MSGGIELADGTLVPIQDTVCECGHWYDEHADGEPVEAGCGAPGCGCGGFVADPEASTAEAIADRGGDPASWPDHVKLAVLLREVRDRVVGEGCPVESCEVVGDGLRIEYAGNRYLLSPA